MVLIIGLTNEFRTHQKINRRLKGSPEEKQKMDILGTYPSQSYKSNYNMLLILLLTIISIIILSIAWLVLLNKWTMEKYLLEAVPYVMFVIFLIMVLIFLVGLVLKLRLVYKIIVIVKKKYNNANIKLTYSIRENLIDDMTFRIVNCYKIRVKEYSCMVINYQLHKRVINYNKTSSFDSEYKYQIMENNLSYEYDLGRNTNLSFEIDCECDNFDSYQISQILKDNLRALSKSRIMNVIINDNKLKIIKKIKIERLFSARTIKEITTDIDDVKVFYQKIVKEFEKQ